MSKFLTWTKGDRRSEALRSGVIPIPVECISFRGLDVSQAEKGTTKRRPLPLAFGHHPQPCDNDGATNSTIALHDAAVQSATSLMAVMNDMLRSPHLSAHLQSRSGGLQPMYGRPRSHTAPSTPIVEAPSIEPFELPGSLPLNSKLRSSLQPAVEMRKSESMISVPNAILGQSIERPHTSPQESAWQLPRYQRKSSESNLSRQNYQVPTTISSPSVVKTPQKLPRSRSYIITNPSEEDTSVLEDSGLSISSTQRPSTKASHRREASPCPSLPNFHNGSTYNVPQAEGSLVHASTVQTEYLQQADTENLLMEQLSLMRSSHEAHLKSLREAHEREIASHRSYIAFLEKRRAIQLQPSLSTSASRQHLTIDTSHASGKPGEVLTSEASATTLQSFEVSLDQQKLASHENNANDIESLKRKLSLFRKAQTESGEVRRERDQLRDTVERNERRIGQLKDIVRKAKENEKLLKNANENLESKLEAANNARTDALEGFHEACETVRTLARQEAASTQEVQDLRARMFYANGSYTSLNTTVSDKTHDRSRHARARSDLSLQVWQGDPLFSQVGHLQRLVAEKDAVIKSLEQETWRIRQLDQESATAKIAEMQARLKQQAQALASAEADRDRYNTLLHSELRRQSRVAAQKVHALTPTIEAGAFAAVSEKLSRTRAELEAARSRYDLQQADTANNANPAIPILEKELEHCLKEIIMYKLDVKGYKKDLKKVAAELESLRAVTVQAPPTPDRDSNSSLASGSSSGARAHIRLPEIDGDGLGISLSQLQPPRTPSRTSAATAVSAVSSPPLRPKTPLGTHKKLPKPPGSRTPSPMPQQFATMQGLQRGETLRSLSESIISSYAKRTPPGQAGIMGMGRNERKSVPVIPKSPTGANLSPF